MSQQQYQQDEKTAVMVNAAFKGAGLALLAGGLLAVGGARYSKTFQTLSSPMKAFIFGSGVAATTVVFADHARVQYEDKQLLRHLNYEEAEAKRAEIRASRGIVAEAMYFVRQNRNMVVGLSWLGCMGGSLLYTFAKPGLTTTQRIVTARMYAQGFTILTMMAVAALELTDDGSYDDDKNEFQHESMTDELRAILAKDSQGQYIDKGEKSIVPTKVPLTSA